MHYEISSQNISILPEISKQARMGEVLVMDLKNF